MNQENPYDIELPRGSALKAVGLFLLEIIRIGLISFAIILPVRYFLVQPFFVHGASMSPTYLDKDYLIIDEASFRVFKRDPVRGEVVVFRPPNEPKKFYIKRVIGLPNETIEIKEGKIYLVSKENPEGVVIDESAYLADSVVTQAPKGELRIQLKEDEYYLLGDNREQSFDSRMFGPVHYDSIVGRTWIRGLPLNRAEAFTAPSYNF